MANQNRTTKLQPTQGSTAARQATQAPGDAAKAVRQAADKAELDKLAQAQQAEAVKEVVAETAAEGSVAAADAAAAEGSLGAVSGEAAAGAVTAEAGAAGAAGVGAAGAAAAVSPLAIGAGVVGVAAVAAAGGGSSGGSGSQPIAQNNNQQQGGQDQSGQQPATPTEPAQQDNNEPAQPAEPAKPADPVDPAKPADGGNEQPAEPKPVDPPKVDPAPVEDLSKPATAAGTASEPKVAASGVTNLPQFAEIFKTAGSDGGEAQFIRISRILSAENSKDPDARVIHNIDTNPAGNAGQGAAPAASTKAHAYEVIDAGKAITQADAEAMAKQLGGKLLTIDNAEEKTWLDKNLFSRLGDYDGDKSVAEAESESGKAAQQAVLNKQLAENGAWLGRDSTAGADAKASAVIRNGDGADDSGAMKLYEPEGTTLTKFVIEYDDYQSPLLLDGKPVVEGQIISQADAAKLAWNADQSQAGKITYVAVTSADADTAQVVANAKEGTMTLAESAEVKHPMTQPATPTTPENPAQGGDTTNGGGTTNGGNATDGGNATGDDKQTDETPQAPATAQGTPEAPQVATTGETRLTNVAEAFAKAGPNGAEVNFIKIVGINDAESGEAHARVFREVETTGKAGKATDAAAPEKTVSTTAYEVIDAGKPITRAEAEEMAKARGGKLLTIDSTEEAQFVGEQLFSKLGEYDGEKAYNEAADGSAKAALKEQLDKQLADNGAWLGKDATDGAVAGADAIIRNGNGTDQDKGYKAYDFDGDKLQHFVIEIENYKAPLTLDGEPVVEGKIISKAEFGKLVWNGDHNMGGKITYVAVQSDAPNAPNVEGAEVKTLAVTESANVTHPATPAEPPKGENPADNADQNAGQQGDQTGGDTSQSGSDAQGGTAPGASEGKQDSQDSASSNGSAAAGGSGNDDGKSPSAEEGKQEGEEADEGKKDESKTPESAEEQKDESAEQGQQQGQTGGGVSGDSSAQQPGQAGSGASGDSSEQQQGQSEAENKGDEQPAQPKVGEYPSKAVKFEVAHDVANTKLLTQDSQTSPFAGTDADKAPDAVKIVSVLGPDNENTQGNIMTLGEKDSGRSLSAGQFIDKADFDKVQWNADVDHGSGTYKVQFVPVTADHQDIADAKTQTFTVRETAEQPDYSSTIFSAVAEHNADATFDKAMFEGSVAGKAPMFIRITEINPEHAEAGDHRVLHLVGDRAQDLKVDDSHPLNTVISSAQLGNLRWDAAHNEGGSFKFVALDGDMKPIDASVVQTVTVTEKPDPEIQSIGMKSLFDASEGHGALSGGSSIKSLAYTPAEPASNPLDELHNPITPLI